MVLLKQQHEALCATMHVSSATLSGRTALRQGSAGGSNIWTGDKDSEVINRDKTVTANAEIMTEAEEKINDLSKTVTKCTQNIREYGQELVKFSEINLSDVVNFVTTVVDKAPVLQESMMLIIEARQKFVEMDHKALDVKQRQIELERQASIEAAESRQRQIELERQASIEEAENKQRQIELERQANIEAAESKLRQIELERQANIIAAENRLRTLDVDSKEFHFSELKNDSNKKRALEEETDTQRKELRLSVALPLAQPQSDKVGITVHSVMSNHPAIFDGIPHKDRKDLLIKAGSRCAQTFREAGHVELPKIREGQYDVAVYDKDCEETIISILKRVVGDYNSQYGTVTIEDMHGCITKHMTKAEKLKILHAAEEEACASIQMLPGKKLMKKRGNWQTFSEEDRPILIASIKEAMRQKHYPKDSKPLESFFSRRSNATQK